MALLNEADMDHIYGQLVLARNNAEANQQRYRHTRKKYFEGVEAGLHMAIKAIQAAEYFRHLVNRDEEARALEQRRLKDIEALATYLDARD